MIKFVTPAYPAAGGPFNPRSKASITDLVIHHSAGPLSQTPLEIDAEERNNGYVFMPYTWLIDNEGVVYTGRDPLVESAATFGRNPESVAVCLIGNFQLGDPGYTGPPSSKALDSLLELSIYVHENFPIERTYAHGDVASMFYPEDEGNYSTACCGSELRKLLPDIKSKTLAAVKK